MATVLNTQDKPATVPAKVPLAGGTRIAAIVPSDVEQAWRMAGIIAEADMAPKSYNHDRNKIMVGILHGLEVGLTPMAALQSIAVINGMPSIWGDGALALVRGSGLLEDITETLEGDGDKMAATCVLKRRGQETPILGRFSMADAKRAGLAGKQGPWAQYPQRMLQMRARSWALRDGFADILRGLGVAEEARDMASLEPGTDGEYRPAPPRPTRADFAPKPEPEKPVATDAEVAEAEHQVEQQYAATISGRMPDDPPHDENGVVAEPAPAQWSVDAMPIPGLPKPKPADVLAWARAVGDHVNLATTLGELKLFLKNIDGGIVWFKTRYAEPYDALKEIIDQKLAALQP